MIETSFFVLFLAGLLGGGHCIGMCGGIVTALTFNLPRGRRRWGILLGYNLGRMTSYVVIGAVLGALAHSVFNQTRPLQIALYLLANLMIIAMGLYLAGLSSAIVLMEKIGQPVWRRLQPLVKGLLPVKSFWQAIAAGMVWGWLPCGLVYSASLSALASGSARSGALAMLCFALGTLPNLLAMGAFADTLRGALQKGPVRLAAGLLVTAMGALQLGRMIVGTLGSLVT
jgi:sulfite exporter TauE/SafE